MLCVFFFKQKTAYEMRISDWSSDVCSSDLQRLVSPPLDRRTDAHGFAIFGNGAAGDVEAFCPQQVHQRVVGQDFLRIFGCDQGLDMTQIGRASCRERVCTYV